jgi:aspartyl aminopeptidase
MIQGSQAAAKGFIEFVNGCPTPYHVVQQSRELLLAKGFKELDEQAGLEVKASDSRKYFFTRGGSSLIAFVLPVGYSSQGGGARGIRAVGSHTDSPCLRLAPHSLIEGQLQQFNVVTYGGGLWGTWFDRDLGLAGRVLFRKGDRISSRLWKSDHPLCRIPHLAIHLRETRDKDTISKDTSLRPIFLC